MVEDTQVIYEKLDTLLVRTRKVIINKTGKKSYKYKYIVKRFDEELYTSSNKDFAIFNYKLEIDKIEKIKIKQDIIKERIIEEYIPKDSIVNPYDKKLIDYLKEHIPKQTVVNPYDRKLIELIEFRLNAIHTVTISDYKVVKDIIKTAYLYNLNVKYIRSIKNRFRHFRL